jgi:hypothetical protein
MLARWQTKVFGGYETPLFVDRRGWLPQLPKSLYQAASFTSDLSQPNQKACAHKGKKSAKTKEQKVVRHKWLLITVMVASVCYGKEPKRYESGQLLSMESSECGFDENSGKSLAGEVLGTDSAHKKTHALLCQEYLLESERVIYRIRPKDDKHPVLLPVGEKAQFRLEKDKMKLRVEDLDDKEREYIVVSMTPRGDSSISQKTLR